MRRWGFPKVLGVNLNETGKNRGIFKLSCHKSLDLVMPDMP